MVAPTRKKVLICDDDPVILRLLQVNLELEGYDPLLAHHGEEALEVATAEDPDLVILDIMMPHMDGYETCRRLKSSNKTRDIPIIFLSARTEKADLERARQQGVADYLTKPFDPAELLAVVGRLVR